jgi:MYXO-CTERM domain-containing protein
MAFLRSEFGGAFVPVLLLTTTPVAALTQPGGTVLIPTDDEVRMAIASRCDPADPTRCETVDPRVTGAVTPETFRPECSLTFTVLLRMSDYDNSFGWYNVTGRAPALNELYEFIHCDDPPANWDQSYTNLTSRVLDIRNDPRYAGGEIGFFQAVKMNGCADVTNPSTVDFVVYSERALNPDSSDQNPFIHLMIMDSSIQDNVFYFAWEDQLRGDDDFSDLVLRVEGISCAAGGDACQTGLDGVCARGATRCQAGEIVCGPIQPASDERCNALDDDCNGLVDDGDLCGENEICDRGVCIHVCGSGEFTCPGNQVCREDGYCVDRDCLNVDCPPGQTCFAGQCVDPCTGVVCPFEQECRAGRCVDPCTTLTCGDGQVCKAGACVTSCACSGCPNPAAFICTDPGLCVENACQTATCPEGTHCAGGDCVDDCEGAVCPNGQSCVLGNCEGELVGPGGPPDGGAQLDGGLIFTPPDASVGGSGGSAGGSSGADPIQSRKGRAPGCACRTLPDRSDSLGLLGLLALSAAALKRRRLRKG